MKISLFIVDDHFMVIEGIRTLLGDEDTIEWMGHATHADSCLAFLKHHRPDIILMDVSIPGMSGLDLCREVKKTYPDIGVIGLSTFNEQGFIEQMMAYGASGYVLKNATRQELLEAIHEVSLGRTYLSLEAAEMVRKSHVAPLVTRREMEVLKLLAEGLTNQEIADRLFLSVNTVDSHRKSLLAKMHARNTAELIRLAFQNRIIPLP